MHITEPLLDIIDSVLAQFDCIYFRIHQVHLFFHGFDDDIVWFDVLLYALVFFLAFYLFIEDWKFGQDDSLDVLETLQKALFCFILASNSLVDILF